MYIELIFIIIGICATDVYWIAGAYLFNSFMTEVRII